MTEAARVRNTAVGAACSTASRVVLHTSTEHLTIEVVGELDRRAAKELLAVLLPAIRGGNRIVHLDLGRVSYVDRSGVDALRTATSEAEARRAQLVVLQPSPAARSTRETAGRAVSPLA